MPLVSVIIPVYNVEKYVKASVESAMAQTVTDIEIILVNDGSTDRSGELCRELAACDGRIIVTDKANGGVSSARNSGLENSSGEWIYFMDSDDVIEPDTLECALKKAQETGTDVCFFDFDRIYENAVKPSSSLADNDGFTANTDCYRAMYSFNRYGSMCNLIIRAELIRGKVFFNESIAIGEDLLFKFECFCRVKAYSYVPQVKYHYIIRNRSAIQSVRNDYASEADRVFEALTEVKEKYDLPEYADRYINSVYIEFFYRLIMNTFSSGNKTKLSRKLDIIEGFTGTERFKEAFRNYDPAKCGRAVMIHKNFNRKLWLVNYLVYLVSAYKNSRNKPSE